MNTNGLGDAQHRFNGYDFLPALDLAQVLRVEINLLGKFFLRQICPFPVLADGLTNDSAVP